MFIKWILTTAAILMGAYLIPGVVVSGVWPAIWVALFLGLINITLKPVLIILTLPFNILTLGLFTFVINGALLLLTGSVIQGFSIDGLLTAILFSIVLSIITSILNILLGRD